MDMIRSAAGALRAPFALGAGLFTAAGAALLGPSGAGVPVVTAATTARNAELLSFMPMLQEVYTPYYGLANGHVSTVFAALTRRGPEVAYKREIVENAEHVGVFSLDWPVMNSDLPPTAATAILLPGLTGGSGDTYIRTLIVSLHAAGVRSVVFNSRGCAESPVTSPQFYSASFTGDCGAVIRLVHARFPAAPLVACGWSLGANILLRHLGEEKKDTPLVAAVSLCNPFDLPMSDRNFQRGFNRVYDFKLAAQLRSIYARHAAVFESHAAQGTLPPRMDHSRGAAARTIREFDHAITAPAFGWASVDAYYAGSSSALSVPHIAVPTLCIQAEDDPIAPAAAIPRAALLANPLCILVTTPSGGHLGWIAGPTAPLGAPWTDPVIVAYIRGITARAGAARMPDLQPSLAGHA